MPDTPWIVSGPEDHTAYGDQSTETWPMWEFEGPPNGFVIMEYPGMDEPIRIPMNQEGNGSYAVPPNPEYGLYGGETYDFSYWAEDDEGNESDTKSFTRHGSDRSEELRARNAARNRAWKEGGLESAWAATERDKPTGTTSRPMTGGGGGPSDQVAAGGGGATAGSAASGAGSGAAAAEQRQSSGVEKGNTP